MENNYSVEQLKKCALEYLSARKKFTEIANQTQYLWGNDNIIGRIGEFVAYQYLEKTERQPARPTTKTNKVFDFLCDNNTVKVQVKTITYESKFKQSTRVTGDWDELILVYISDELKIGKMGHLTRKQLAEAVKNPKQKSKSMEPQVNLYMLGENGIISKYGKFIEASSYL